MNAGFVLPALPALGLWVNRGKRPQVSDRGVVLVDAAARGTRLPATPCSAPGVRSGSWSWRRAGSQKRPNRGRTGASRAGGAGGGTRNAADPASLAEPSPSGWPKKGRRSRPVHPACSGAPARGPGIASEKMLKSRTGATKEGELRERRTTVGGVHASAPSFFIVRSSPARR